MAGLLGNLNLYEWWFADISSAERLTIKTALDGNPLGRRYSSLITGEVSDHYDTFVDGEIITVANKKRPTDLLTLIAGNLDQKRDFILILKLLNKAESVSEFAPLIDLHFLYLEFIRYYKNYPNGSLREEYLKKTVSISAQTALEFKNEYKDIPLPYNLGIEGWYECLVEKQQFQEAVNLIAEARAQGWRLGNLEAEADNLGVKNGIHFEVPSTTNKYSFIEIENDPYLKVEYLLELIELDL